MPSAEASVGPLIATSWSSKRISPPSIGWIPATHLTSFDLPAPLSPTRAVTSPARTEKSTSCSTWTAPKLLLTLLSCSSIAASSAAVPDPWDGRGGRSYRPPRPGPGGDPARGGHHARSAGRTRRGRIGHCPARVVASWPDRSLSAGVDAQLLAGGLQVADADLRRLDLALV